MNDVVPTLEALMEKLEKIGMEKQASELRDILSQVDWSPWATRRWERRPDGPQAPGVPPADPSQKGFQEGERYTDLATGKTQRYQMEGGPTTSQLKTYFDKGMLITDFLQKQHDLERDPHRKEFLRDLLQKAIAQEEGGQAGRALNRCASVLREKGYDALAQRLDDKVAAGVYRPGDGVRIKSLQEYMAKSEGKGGKDTSLFDEMLDKYIRVLEGAAAILEQTKRQLHDPKGLEDAMKPLLTGNQLMMQKLLEIGEAVR